MTPARSRGTRILMLGCVALLAIACASGTRVPTSPTGSATSIAPALPTGDVASPTAASPSSTKAPSSTSALPSDPAPAELQGTWTVTIPSGPEEGTVQLTILPTMYRIVHSPNVGQGRISVRGDEITFLSSTLCDGRGTYHWVIEGDKLTFTAVGPPDTCGRAVVLDKRTYTMVSH